MTAERIGRKPVYVRVPRLGEEASQRRSLDERLFVRFPSLFRVFAGAVARLRPGSRLRRLMIGRAVARAYAAGNRRDFEVLLLTHDRDHEYRPSPKLMPPDLQPVFRGHDGYLRLWQYWMDAFGDIRWDPEEVLDLGDRFVVSTEQTGHGSASGVAVSEPVFQLFEMRRGLVMRQTDFLDRSEALAAATRT
jgi:ketosteroid isomerase-like protein